jgi:hypothetical protein
MGTLRYSLLIAVFCESCMTILLFIVFVLGGGWGCGRQSLGMTTCTVVL